MKSNQVEVTCAICGKVFSVKASRANQNRNITCGSVCLSRLRSAQRVQHFQTEDTRIAKCDYCGKEFTRKPSQISKYAAHYCGRACRKMAMQGMQAPNKNGDWYECEECGKLTWRTPATLKEHVYCNRRCAGIGAARRYSNLPEPRLSGPDHARWTGGPAPYTPGWGRKLSALIRSRDGNRCQICRVAPDHPGMLVVHHIDQAKDNHSPENLITLCRPCHNAVHNGLLALP